MLGKFEILIVIFIILFLFYVVIALGARKKELSTGSKEIKKYLLGVRILILIIAIVSFVLWLVGFYA